LETRSSVNHQPERSVDERPDPHADALGVLTGDMIQAYVDELEPRLIDGFQREHLRAASYELTLGDEYYQNGKVRQLSDDERFVILEPHEMAIITSREFLHMPRYLIGRWNLRISLIYKGLLWSGAAQVDPGYYGNLFCPLYNLSNHQVEIERQEHVFTIDFVKTTPYRPGITPPFSMKRYKSKVGEYTPSYPLTSSVATLKTRVDEGEKKAADFSEKISSKISELQSSVLVGLSIVFAGLTIVATLPDIAGKSLTLPPVDLYSGVYLSLSVVALILSAFAFLRSRKLDSSSILSELNVLETMRNTNVITIKDYEKRKKKLLRRFHQ